MTGAELIHEALVYDDDEGFVTAMTPFVADGLRDEEAVVVVVTGHNIDLLRQQLGDDAGEVAFIDRDDWYVRPATTIAGWTGLLNAAQARGKRSMRIIGEVAFGAGARHDTWIRYESAINDVFADAPAWIVCPYDTRCLPSRIIESARRTHPIVAAGRRESSDAYQQPRHLLRTLAEPLPPIARKPLIAVSLAEPTGTRRARGVVEAVAQGLGWRQPAIDDLLLVLTEVAVNSLAHGGDDRHLSVWTEHTTITCEVTDNGAGFADPLAGYCPPEHPERQGVGLWLANQLSDWLAADHRDGTTRVRFRFSQ